MTDVDAGAHLLKTAAGAAGDSVKAMVNSTHPAHLATNAAAIAASLRGSLEPGWPYPWDADHVVVRRKGWFSDRLVLLPTVGAERLAGAAAPPTAPGGAVASPFLFQINVPRITLAPWAASALRFGATVVATVLVVLWCEGKRPDFHPVWPHPFVKSVAYQAGVAEHKAWLAPVVASFATAASDVQGGADLETAKAAHKKRLEAASKLPPNAALTSELDKLVPAGTDPKTVTPATRTAYARVLSDFGQGLADKSGWLP